jgi:hypothetical protein
VASISSGLKSDSEIETWVVFDVIDLSSTAVITTFRYLVIRDGVLEIVSEGFLLALGNWRWRRGKRRYCGTRALSWSGTHQ